MRKKRVSRGGNPRDAKRKKTATSPSRMGYQAGKRRKHSF